ncbi:MAG: NAD(P)-binding domain-containing protein [Nitrospinota bacterium]
MIAIWSLYCHLKGKAQKKNISIRDEAIKAGMTEPSSIHPTVNVNRCMGCGSCANACPENGVLGVINGKSTLLDPTHCIGHGACKTACPQDAITLVFGTEKRGVDIPAVGPSFETNVPGIFIAGELGGMGLIRNAIEQGKQAIESVRKLAKKGKEDLLDVFIVGAGPAGFAASLSAMDNKMRYVCVDQETLGGTVAHYPRGKVVMTSPVEMPVVGKVKFQETTKEKLLEFWHGVESDTGVKINYQERVDDVSKTNEGFEIRTSRGKYRAKSVLLSLGRRGTPRKLGVPGEEDPKVVYRLIDPEQYRGKHVLVVGGGDSALESATSIAAEPDTTVAISYRNEAFSRAKEKNRQKVKDAESEGKLRVLMKSQVKSISSTHVKLTQEGEHIEIPNDAIIVCAGGILPTIFLKKIGIDVDTKFGTA